MAVGAARIAAEAAAAASMAAAPNVLCRMIMCSLRGSLQEHIADNAPIGGFTLPIRSLTDREFRAPQQATARESVRYRPGMTEGASDSDTPAALTLAQTSTRRAVLNTLRGSAGNLVEWYDVYVYTAFAPFFEAQFFDKADKNSTVYVYAIFAVTFIMRPVGSWFFGRFADRRGRKAALMLSITVMSTCSFVIAVMPTREILGYWAVVILLIARLVQGFATGGEYGTSATYMSEAATANRRGFLSSFQYVTLIGGLVLAQLTLLVTQSVLGDETVKAWGWRIGFFIGGAAALVVLWLRRSMDESLSESHLDAIREGKDRDAGSLKTLFVAHWRPLVLVFLITAGGTIAFYTYTVNAPKIVSTALGPDRTLAATWVNLLALIVLLVLQPIGGLVSDRVGRRPLLIFFGVGGAVYTWVLLTYLPKTTSVAAAFLLLIVSYVILTGYTSVNAIVKAELFPAEIRALGVGLGYALANSVFGGTAPVLYEAAKKEHPTLFIVYVTVVIAVSLLVYVFGLKNKGETVLDREQGSAWTLPAR
jgi:MHS family alpha-ketoglutarate permease-like MFS transporter